MTWEELDFKFKKEKLSVECLSLEQRHAIIQIIADHEPGADLQFVGDEYTCSTWPYIGFGRSHWALNAGRGLPTINYEEFCDMWFGSGQPEVEFVADLEDIL